MITWRFRKSLRLGGLFRVNFSGGGIGLSVGVPGYRLSLGPDMKIRKTISLSGTGLYKTEVIGSIKDNGTIRVQKRIVFEPLTTIRCPMI